MTTIGRFDTHPAAECLPLMEGPEWIALLESIALNGQRQPIVLDPDGRILDGRNRARACLELGREPITVVHDGDPIRFVIDQNLRRRHLTIGQLAYAADQLARLPAHRPSESVPRGILSRDEAAALTGASVRTTARVAELREAGRQDLVDQIGRGHISPMRALRLANRDSAAERLRSKPTPLPEGPFDVIVCDPPWRYEKRANDDTSRGHVDYPDAESEDFEDLPIGKLASPDAILWLWTTNAHMEEALGLVRRWGFEQKTILTWAKNRFGMGDFLRGQTEHAIMAIRGRPTVVLTNQSTLLHADVRQHSRKPDAFYALVDRLCPGSKLDMFGREHRVGWTTWGAESDRFTEAA